MVIHVTVKSGQRFDKLVRRGDGLVAFLRIDAGDSGENTYLLKYLGERLNVAKSLIEITAGESSTKKTIWVKIPYADLVSRVKKLAELPQASLFED